MSRIVIFLATFNWISGIGWTLKPLFLFLLGACWNFSKFRPTTTKIEKNFYWFILRFRQFGAFYKKKIFFQKKIINYEVVPIRLLWHRFPRVCFICRLYICRSAKNFPSLWISVRVIFVDKFCDFANVVIMRFYLVSVFSG